MTPSACMHIACMLQALQKRILSSACKSLEGAVSTEAISSNACSDSERIVGLLLVTGPDSWRDANVMEQQSVLLW